MSSIRADTLLAQIRDTIALMTEDDAHLCDDCTKFLLRQFQELDEICQDGNYPMHWQTGAAIPDSLEGAVSNVESLAARRLLARKRSRGEIVNDREPIL